jgi:hypothetical protein
LVLTASSALLVRNIKQPTLIVHGNKDIVALPINAFILTERPRPAKRLLPATRRNRRNRRLRPRETVAARVDPVASGLRLMISRFFIDRPRY